MVNGGLPGTITDAGPGCTDADAVNYDEDASEDNGSCVYAVDTLSAEAGSGEVELTRSAPVTGEYLPVSYSILYTPDDGEISSIDPEYTSFTLEELTNNVTYTIQLCAVYMVEGDDEDEYAVVACKTVSARPT